MFTQMRYISSMSLGFARENRVNVVLRGSETILSADAIRTELLTNPDVLGVSWMATPLGVGSFGTTAIGLETNDGTIETTTLSGMGVGPDFINVMGMKLVAGRDLADVVASAAGAGGPGAGGGGRGAASGPSLPDEFNAELAILSGKKLTAMQIRDFLSGEFTPLPIGDVMAVLRAREAAGAIKLTAGR
jgi:hypothetical protein